MKTSYIKKGIIAIAATMLVAPATINAAEVEGLQDFKLYLDPGHAQKENRGLYSYSEAEKTLRVAWAVRDYLLKYTDIPAENIKLCRETDEDFIDLNERIAVANAWDADFYYSIHSDAGDSNTPNTTLTMFGGWRKDGVEIEKTPNGGKAFGEILCPNLTGVMQIDTRGNYYDRCYYDKTPATHTNQYPYLAVNRQSNMPSLLSEAGYHTNAFQQQRNLNANYKKLEGYAAFRSILEYCGVPNPVQPLLVGVIRNSENEVPVNGVTVTVDGKTVTTDSYESLFSNYSKDPNMLHNGFYMFEDLEAGKEYNVEFTADGYETVSKTVTMLSVPEGRADENVTWLDVTMTSVSPAKIDQISITDPTAVSLRAPIVLTFSRNMDRASVESAFSISNDADVTLSWVNDYTLSIDISKLTNGTSYQIKIDGSIAKNSQTNQFFDGDGDGEEGGDYVLDFTIEPLDLTAPEIVSVDPAVDGEALGTNRPTIRIELSEEINWNEDKYIDLVSVKDSDGKTYGGSISHAVIGGISVIHYKLAEDLPLDKCIQVSVNGGIEDFGGNQSEPYSWKFLTEYRPVINRTMVSDLDSEAGWWAPAGSGSSAGLVQDANSWAAVSDSYSVESAGSCKLTYAFDAMATTPSWMIRQYCSSAAGVVVANNVNGMLNFWLYGDGSNNKVSVMVRANNGSGGLKHPVMIPVSFRGWKHITWDMKNDPYEAFTGTEELNGAWILDSFFIVHENTDDTPDVPQQAWEGKMLFDDLEYIIYDETAVRTATLDDFDSVDELESSRLYVYMSDGVLHVEEPALKAVSVYNVSGQEIAGASATESFAFDMSACPNGIYIVKIQTENGIFSQKIIK